MMTFIPPADRDWASTVTPAVQSPPSGVLGSFDIASGGALTPATIYYTVVLRVTVALRNRA